MEHIRKKMRTKLHIKTLYTEYRHMHMHAYNRETKD